MPNFRNLRDRRRALACAGVVCGLAVAGSVPATASAADADAYAAWTSHNARITQLSHEYRRGVDRWERSEYRRAGAALTAVRRTLRVVRRLKVQVQATHASSDTGVKAKRRAVLSLNSLARGVNYSGKAIRAFMRFDGYRYIVDVRKARRAIKGFRHYQSQARQLFHQVGVKLTKRPTVDFP